MAIRDIHGASARPRGHRGTRGPVAPKSTAVCEINQGFKATFEISPEGSASTRA